MLRSTVLLLALFGIASPLSAQVSGGAARTPVDPLSLPRPVMTALKIQGGINIDGRLDDAAWARATPTSETWIQITPEPGMPASESTVVRILYDDDKLYIGAVMHDSNVGALSVPGLEQDFDTPNSDIFGFALDTYHDKQNGFVFAVNPAGAMFDAQAFDDQRSITTAWEGITEVRTTITDSSWVAEIAIPFATLRFNPTQGPQTWGLNFSRRLRRKNEDSMWAAVPLQFRVYKFSMAGTLEGLRDLPAGRNLWVKPYVLGDWITGPAVVEEGSEGAVGLDLKWGVTPKLTLDLTANTDFSQVEVDAEQVNLTRFSLFFPEKRDFFLENEGTFAFEDVSVRNFRTGSSNRKFRLFHSRRIGLSPSREPLPILAGARMTGRIGEQWEVGLINMQTRSVLGPEDGASFDAENFSVARVKRHLSGGSNIGAMFVNRQSTGLSGRPAEFNRAYGIDGNFNVLPTLVVSAYAARTDESTPSGDDKNVAMVQAAWRSAVFNSSFLFKHVGDGFNPGTGFIDRTAVRRYYGTVGFHPKVRKSGILEINPYFDVDAYTTLNGSLETRTLTPGVQVSLMNGGSLTMDYADHYEQLFATTSIAGASLAAGEYRWRAPSMNLMTAGNKALSGRVSFSKGDFYDGERTSVSFQGLYRPNEHFSLRLSAQHNDLKLGGTDFTADLFSGQLRYAKDTRTFLMGFVQYNEATEEMVTNVRFNLIHAPLSDLFLVFTERRSLAGGVTTPVLERGITLKFTKLFAF
jgi:hypothetical protein